MKCPVDKAETLQSATLTSGVPAHRCSVCQGIWISSNEYLTWLHNQAAPLAEKSIENDHIPTWDTQELKLCPDCDRILARYKVLPGGNFRLDRCGHCNGVWFDKNEWEVLVERNLQDKVNAFFTHPWQLRVKEEETRRMLDKLYRDRFGPADYAKVQDVWQWLRDHPQRAMLLAYLQADDPYKV
jgi:Zn-finger nucleic acid-binding protein